MLLPHSSFSHVQQSQASGTSEWKFPTCALAACCLSPAPRDHWSSELPISCSFLGRSQQRKRGGFLNAAGSRVQVRKAGDAGVGALLLTAVLLWWLVTVLCRTLLPESPAGSYSFCPGSPLMHQKVPEGRMFQRWS